MTIWAPFEKYGDDIFTYKNNQTYNMRNLYIDEFYFNFIGDNVTLKRINKDCVDCQFQEISVSPIFKSDTRFKYQTVGVKTCTFDDEFGEFGVYNIYTNNCTVEEIREPVSIYFPVLSIFLIYITLGLLIYGVTKCLPQFFEPEEASNKNKKRMTSLDAFRGLTIMILIFQNYGHGGYYYLAHAPWNGLYGADLLQAWFMWVMGVAISITLPSKLKLGNKKEVILDTMKRSIKLFCLGMFLSSGTNLFRLKIMGVLQQFGIAYFVVTMILIFFVKIDANKYKTGYTPFLKDIYVLRKAWVVAIFLVIVHCLIIFLIHEKDCPRGYMGPGGNHNNGKYHKCVGGATGFIDRFILGENYMHNCFAAIVFSTGKPFECHGLVACLTIILHVFIGVQAGNTYAVYKNEDNPHFKILVRWLLWGVGTGLVGGLLCGFSKEDGIIPVNFQLWSISFVLVTSSMAFTILSLFYVLIDQKMWWSGKPLLFAGMNGIVLYIGELVTKNYFPFTLKYKDLTESTHFWASLSHTFAACMWLFISYVMFRKQIFVSL